MRNGVERLSSVDVPMDGAGMRGNANMSAPQAYASTITYGRKLALTLLFNLTVSTPQRPAEPRPERQQEEPPSWDAPSGRAPPWREDARLEALRHAAKKSDNPPSDKQIEYLNRLLAERDEPVSAVLDDQGRLSGRDAWQAISARKAVRP